MREKRWTQGDVSGDPARPVAEKVGKELERIFKMGKGEGWERR